MSRSADLVVIGHVAGVRGRELDGGGDAETESSTPMVFYDYAIDEVVAGGTSQSRSLVLGWVDLDKSQMEGASKIDKGAMTMLFLRLRTDADSPGIESEGDFYVPVSGDNGVFDVEGARVQARSKSVRGLTDPTEPAAKEANMFFVSDVQTVKQKAREAKKEVPGASPSPV